MTTVAVNTKDLIGQQLDYAVMFCVAMQLSEGRIVWARDMANKALAKGRLPRFSSDESLGGPLLSRYRIAVNAAHGESALVTGLRALVGYQMGHVFHVPASLGGEQELVSC